GPLFGRYIARRIYLQVPDSFTEAEVSHPGGSVSFSQVSTVILLPLVLIMLSTITPIWFGETHVITSVFGFVGHPFVAL
ncbi:MAG: gluconate transporter, partial [Burkholderiales bacterium]|nr:gluconate transporter [Burkholderiales bacterium]